MRRRFSLLSRSRRLCPLSFNHDDIFKSTPPDSFLVNFFYIVDFQYFLGSLKSFYVWMGKEIVEKDFSGLGMKHCP